MNTFCSFVEIIPWVIWSPLNTSRTQFIQRASESITEISITASNPWWVDKASARSGLLRGSICLPLWKKNNILEFLLIFISSPLKKKVENSTCPTMQWIKCSHPILCRTTQDMLHVRSRCPLFHSGGYYTWAIGSRSFEKPKQKSQGHLKISLGTFFSNPWSHQKTALPAFGWTPAPMRGKTVLPPSPTFAEKL